VSFDAGLGSRLLSWQPSCSSLIENPGHESILLRRRSMSSADRFNPTRGGILVLLAGFPLLGATTPSPPPNVDVSDCKVCHEKAVAVFEQTRHAKLPDKCATCHGDVAGHVKAETESGQKGEIVSFKKMAAASVKEKCLSCHDKARQANWDGGVHDRRGLSCTTCHSMHDFKGPKAQIKTAMVQETCYTCHPAMRAKNMRPSHHPIREGKISCADCHDPHDGTKPKMISAESVNEKCYTCHTEKRGPFLWEHAPVRESCLNCHDPHGSNHEKLLILKRPWLCQRCHLNTRHPGTFYDLSNTPAGKNPGNRAAERACQNCHLNIHGSNTPSGPYMGR
jgi:DmsE family decaheme c-type cytochrome